MAIITYEGYALYEAGGAYKSLINDRWMTFDSAGQWKRYIDKLRRK